jgi:hypothetical protein
MSNYNGRTRANSGRGIRAGAPFQKRFDHYTMPVTESGCMIWLGGLDKGGYGQFHCTKGSNVKKMAHRASYEHFIGPVPEGMDLDHLCRVRCCVNPDHLEPVSRKENVRRGETGRNLRRENRNVAR